MTEVTFTKKKGERQFNLAAYWQKKSQKKALDVGWYILTNLDSLAAALKADKARSGIEAMFSGCTSSFVTFIPRPGDQNTLLHLVTCTASK